MRDKVVFDPDNIPFTEDELRRTTILYGKKEIDAAQKIRRARAEYDHLITHIMNKVCVPGYKIGIIPDYYEMPIFTDEKCLEIVKLDPQLNILILESKIAIRRKVIKDCETAQRMNKLARYERDNYDQ